MKTILLGTDDDALGFHLAGATTFTASTREDVEKCLRRITTSIDEPIIIFSRKTADLISDWIDQWSRHGDGPMFVVLPRGAECR